MSIEQRSRQYGKVFDHWQIKEYLGEGSGGKSAVFRMVHSSSSSVKSALKVVNLIEEKGDVEKLSEYHSRMYAAVCKECSDAAEQEVFLMNDLQGHTNIVDYLDHTFVDWSDEYGYGRDMLIRMELLQDLRAEMYTDKIYDEKEIIKIGHDICTALVLCHGKHILHRDIKPENIFYNRKHGNYKLGDFGISKILNASPKAQANTGIGTEEYAAPEQLRGYYDNRVDIYSLGLVLYELSNGKKLPFATSHYICRADVQRRISGEQLPVPCNASPLLAGIILKACAPNPDDRFQTAQEFLDELDACRKAMNSQQARLYTRYSTQKANAYEVSEVNGKKESDQPGQNKTTYVTMRAKESERTGMHGVPDATKNLPERNNKVRYVFVAVIVLILLAVGFFTIHFWEDPTCTDAATCFLCGKAKGDPNGHEWKPATCTDPKTCTVCGTTEGTADPHEWVDATFSSPKYCAVCLISEGESMGDIVISDAEELLADGKYVSAIQMLDNAWKQYGEKTYYETAAQYRKSFGIYNASKFAAARFNTVFLKEDGTVDIVGEDTYHELDARNWSGIQAISIGDRHVVGLTTSGTVLSAGDNWNKQIEGVDTWRHVVAISAGDVHTVALLEDGTVVASEGNNYYGQCDVEVLMRKAGNKKIVSVSAGYVHTLALLEDGTVVACGDNTNGACDVSRWKDIVAIYTGSEFSAGLKSDGTVEVTGLGTSKWNTHTWTNLVNLAAGDYYLVGVKDDGSVVADGIHGGMYPEDKGQFDVYAWRDIVAVAAGNDHTVALSSDGYIWCTGGNHYGQCSYSGIQLYAKP